jgi:hypothetical protein
METKLFRREGTPFNLTTEVRNDGLYPYFMEPRKCYRCGGQGGSDAWKNTGYKCYDCLGSGMHKNGPQKVRLYTEEQLTRLNAIKAKKDATEQAKGERAKAKAEEEAFMRMLMFTAKHGDLLDRAEPYETRSEFIRDVCAKAREKWELSDKQAEALSNAIARFQEADKGKEASEYMGSVGERLRGLQATVIKQVVLPVISEFSSCLTITTLRAETGEMIVVKSNAFRARPGAVLVIDGSVKKHNIYNGEKQTQLKIVKIKKVVFEPEEEEDLAA